MDKLITTLVKHSNCPVCDADIDAATGEAEPSDGDVTICAYCCSLLFFNEDLTLRTPTHQESIELLKDPIIQQHLDAVRHAWKERNHHEGNTLH